MKILIAVATLAFISCNNNGTIKTKHHTPICGICSFTYRYSVDDDFTFEDSCKYYKVGDRIK